MFRKWFAILMIAVYAFANTELHQLLKLPVLTSHFMEHRSENPELTLVTFLYLHYILPQPKDKDYNRDMQLPFKTDVCSVFHVVVAPHSSPILFSVKPPVYHERKYCAYQAPFLYFTALNDIWQPPRIC